MGTNEAARYNANKSTMNEQCGRPNSHYLQDAIVGDLFIHYPFDYTYEVMQLIDKGADGKTWTFYRGDFYGYYNLGVPKGARTHAASTIYTWYNTPNHTYNVKSGAAAWDFMADPFPTADHDAIIQMNDMSDGHGWEGWLSEGRTGIESPICGLYCVGVRTGPIEQRWPMTGIRMSNSR